LDNYVCSVLPCVAVCCSVLPCLQSVAVSPNVFIDVTLGRSCVRRPTATYCYTLQTQCNSLQYTATHCNTLQRMCQETHSNILLHAPDTLQLTVIHGNIMQHTATHVLEDSLQHTATCRNSLCHTAPHCNTLQHMCWETHCLTLQHILTTLQFTVTHGNTRQHTATFVSGDSLQHAATNFQHVSRHVSVGVTLG